MELALVDRPVAEEAGRHGGSPERRIRERDADRQRQAPADDRIAAVEPALPVEQVHRTAATAAASLALAQHLGHDGVCGHASSERLPMLAIGGHYRIRGSKSLHDADGDGLLAVVEMQET